MQITLNLTIAADTTPETLTALMEVLAKYETAPAPIPPRSGAPMAEKGPFELEFLARTGLSKMRLTGPFQSMPREVAAQAKLAELDAGGAPMMGAQDGEGEAMDFPPPSETDGEGFY